MTKIRRRYQRRHWHSEFLALLPAIRQQAEFSLQDYDPESKDDALSEILAYAACAYYRLFVRGLKHRAFASTLTRFAMKGYRAGRRTGTKTNSNDVYSQSAMRQSRLRTELSSRRSSHSDERLERWISDSVVDSRRASIADQVAFRIDFADWLTQMSTRDRAIAGQLAMGYTTREVSCLFQLSAGRISQLRRELEQSWNAFVADHSEGAQRDHANSLHSVHGNHVANEERVRSTRPTPKSTMSRICRTVSK